MKSSRFKTLSIGLVAGVIYASLCMLIVNAQHRNVSIAFIFILPLFLGAIPVLFSTKEQLESYWAYIVLPWGITIIFFLLALISGFEGMICLVIIVGPFLILGSLGGFIYRIIKLRNSDKRTHLYLSLLSPLAILLIEANIETNNRYYTISKSIEINANRSDIWLNIKNVKQIHSTELQPHFVHIIGIPKPVSAQLDYEGVGGTRTILWERGIKFQEKIKTWSDQQNFTYTIKVDPTSIPPSTLDEHVLIGGRYFDVVEGGYTIIPINKTTNRVTLTCKYRITTNLNFYSKWWADFMLNDFHETILEVVKSRCEK